ncbi:head-tail connector protein [Brevundimonas vesicularis]|uniref:Phage gp6-like head-tail connector protein n=1 Tax=Brevundimonas vesicularis TaxID=41276 RepID=A0A1Z3U5B6_BREVE|nr:head-tail connector protein [Brevundimonas vesicularis]ASE38468.1 phage gp6-like head-tail connector protein [Brevundimonas vesicularis]
MALNVVVTATGPLFTLVEAKEHLRVDHNDDDALIEIYSDAAVGRVLQYCNIGLVPDSPGAAAAFKAAALLALGELYQNREPILTDGSPISNLINPYRWLRV